jgi:uncharacterized protein with PQ loop repeat
MAHDYLMNTASALFFICYIPELYANWKNKNANFYNMPEKALLLVASTFGLSYAIVNDDIALISNYGPLLALDIIAFIMRLYYVYKNKHITVVAPPSDGSAVSYDSETISQHSRCTA